MAWHPNWDTDLEILSNANRFSIFVVLQRNDTDIVGQEITIKFRNLKKYNNYEGRSEINASYFIMFAHDVGGECCWYGSRGWTFPPIFR